MDDYGEDQGDEVAADPGAQLRAALLDTVGLDTIPDPVPVIADVLQLNSLAWLQGKPGNGKSLVALDIAGCVATGQPWQTWPVTQGTALYLAAEGASGLRQRVRAWEQSMDTKMTGVHFLPVAVQVDTAGWRALRRLAVELQPTLIVLDTQARITTGFEENSAKDMGRLVDELERLRRATGACVLVVHHQGRNGEHMRGSSALEGAATTVVQVSKQDTEVTVKCLKQKDAAEFDEFKLRMISAGDSVVLIPDDGTRSRAAGPSTAARKLARDWWAHHGDGWVSASALIDVVATKSTFYRLVRELDQASAALIDRSGRYARYRLIAEPVD